MIFNYQIQSDENGSKWNETRLTLSSSRRKFAWIYLQEGNKGNTAPILLPGNSTGRAVNEESYILVSVKTAFKHKAKEILRKNIHSIHSTYITLYAPDLQETVQEWPTITVPDTNFQQENRTWRDVITNSKSTMDVTIAILTRSTE